MKYAGFLVVGFLLGALEATVTPGFVILTSAWYKQNEQGTRAGLWLSCNKVALLSLALSPTVSPVLRVLRLRVRGSCTSYLDS